MMFIQHLVVSPLSAAAWCCRSLPAGVALEWVCSHSAVLHFAPSQQNLLLPAHVFFPKVGNGCCAFLDQETNGGRALDADISDVGKLDLKILTTAELNQLRSVFVGRMGILNAQRFCMLGTP